MRPLSRVLPLSLVLSIACADAASVLTPIRREARSIDPSSTPTLAVAEDLVGGLSLTRERGAPNSDSRVVSLRGFGPPFRVEIRSGDVVPSAAWVHIDGNEVLGPADLDGHSPLSRSIPLPDDATEVSLVARIASSPGASLELLVYGIPLPPLELSVTTTAKEFLLNHTVPPSNITYPTYLRCTVRIVVRNQSTENVFLTGARHALVYLDGRVHFQSQYLIPYWGLQSLVPAGQSRSIETSTPYWIGSGPVRPSFNIPIDVRYRTASDTTTRFASASTECH